MLGENVVFSLERLGTDSSGAEVLRENDLGVCVCVEQLCFEERGSKQTARQGKAHT